MNAPLMHPRRGSVTRYMNRSFSVFRQLVMAICLVATIAGCTSTTHEWHEEVRLTDGTVLDIERTIRFEKVGVPIGSGSTGWISDGEDLSFVEPGTGRIIEWSAHRRTAALLDRIGGQYVIVAAQSRCEQADKGQPIWRIYVLTPTGWEPRPTADLGGNRSPNLALDSSNYSKTKGWSRLSLAVKPGLDAASQIGRELRTIDLDDPTKCL